MSNEVAELEGEVKEFRIQVSDDKSWTVRWIDSYHTA